MAYNGIFTTWSGAILKMGEMVDTTALVEYNENLSALWAESLINTVARKNFSAEGVYNALVSGSKFFLSNLSATLMAIDFISSNMGAYNSRIEAETLLDLRTYEAERMLKLLGDSKTINWIITGE